MLNTTATMGLDMHSTGEVYREAGDDNYTTRIDPDKQTRRARTSRP